MNPIEVFSIVGRIVGVGVTLLVIRWFTTRRAAARPVGTPDPIRQHLDRTGGPT